MTEILLRTGILSFAYPERTGLFRRALSREIVKRVDLAVPRGSVLGLLGPNGAGKTTAVRMLATLLAPDGGWARVDGHDVVAEPARVRESIGLTGQYASVDDALSGTQNLVMIGRLLDLSRRDARARARELLNWFDLTEAADRPARTYSGGMRRRLDLAASLVGRPSVIFLDEPTTGLDPSKRGDMWQVVRALVSDGATVLLTTQYLDEADALADAITVVDRGRVIAHDTPDGLKRIVGGQTLTLRPTDPSRLADAAAIVSDVAQARTESPRAGVLSVPVSGDEVLPNAVRRLSAAGIVVTELSLHLPSLDEAFLALTGTSTPREPTLVEVAA
jgi:oleandomycin transport system ATP-binding protein